MEDLTPEFDEEHDDDSEEYGPWMSLEELELARKKEEKRKIELDIQLWELRRQQDAMDMVKKLRSEYGDEFILGPEFQGFLDTEFDKDDPVELDHYNLIMSIVNDLRKFREDFLLLLTMDKVNEAKSPDLNKRVN